MKTGVNEKHAASTLQKSKEGITLLELLVVMVVSLVAIGAIYDVYAVQVRHYKTQKTMRTIDQNLRAAMTVLQDEFRKAGYDPHSSRRFGVVDVRRYDLVDGSRANPDGQPGLSFTYDFDENGRLDDRYGGRNREHPKFKIADVQGDGRFCLAFDNGSGRRPVADNIHAMGLAYGVDVDGNGSLDTWNQGPYPIWAVDTDNDNLLDAHLDTNNDGRIDLEDDVNEDGRITGQDGAPLEPPISLDRIKSVQVWLLAVSEQPVKNHRDKQIHVVADQIITPPQDGRIRTVLRTTIAGRNL